MIYDKKTLNFIYSRMLESIEILSLNANEQINTLKGCVVSDEVALSFHDDVGIWAKVLIDNRIINKKQYEKILEIDNKFDKMSDNKDLWTNEQLKSSDIWEECRNMGKELLDSLKKEYNK